MTTLGKIYYSVRCSLLVIVLLTVALGATAVYAQDQQASVLSRYGYGTLQNSVPTALRGMGGASIGVVNSKVINFNNPASFAYTDSISFLIDVAFNLNYSYAFDRNIKSGAILGGVDYIALQFPLYKNRLGFSAGLIPFSNAGYGGKSGVMLSSDNLKEKDALLTTSYDGKGSLQSVYAGLGYRLGKYIRLGASAKYLFGSLTHTVAHTPVSTVLASETNVYNLVASSFDVELGLQGSIPIRQDFLTLGLIYSPQMKLSNRLSYVTTTSFIADRVPEIDTKSYSVDTKLPHRLGGGLAWSSPNRFMIAGDFEYELWSDEVNLFTNDGVGFKNRMVARLGGEYIPNYLSRKYGDIIRYRLGAHYDSGYTRLESLNTHKFGASFGLGLPVNLYGSDRSSLINIGVEYDYEYSDMKQV